MRPHTPITLAVAGYDGLERALRDHDAVWAARREGNFHHSAVAVLTQQPDGEIRIERTDNTAKALTWGDGLLAGALFVLVPDVRFQLLPTLDPVGRRAIARHFHRHIPQDDLVAATGLIQGSRCSLVVVIVNRADPQVSGLLGHAREIYAAGMEWGDLEEELRGDLVAASTRSLPSSATSPAPLVRLPEIPGWRDVSMPSPGAGRS